MKLLGMAFILWLATSLVAMTSLAAALPILQIEHFELHHQTGIEVDSSSTGESFEGHDHHSHTHDDWGIEWLSQLTDDPGLGQLGTSVLAGANASSLLVAVCIEYLPSFADRMASRPSEPPHPPPRTPVAPV